MQVCNKDKLLKTENGFTLLAGFTAITHNSQLTNATVTFYNITKPSEITTCAESADPALMHN